MLHRTNDTPATPIEIVQTWGTKKQVSSFIEDIWPINWTRDAFDHYIRPDLERDERETYERHGQALVDVVDAMAKENLDSALAMTLLLDKAIDLTFYLSESEGQAREVIAAMVEEKAAEAHSHLDTPADKNALVATAELLAKEKAIAAEAEGGAS